MKTTNNIKKGMLIAMMALVGNPSSRDYTYQQPPEQERSSGNGFGVFAQQQDTHRI